MKDGATGHRIKESESAVLEAEYALRKNLEGRKKSLPVLERMAGEGKETGELLELSAITVHLWRLCSRKIRLKTPICGINCLPGYATR